MGKNISTCSCFFGFFGGFLHVFLMYSCSKSSKELKSAIKKIIFPLFGGSGGQIRLLIEKKDGEENWYRRSGPGKDIGSACLLYMGVPPPAPGNLPYIHGCFELPDSFTTRIHQKTCKKPPKTQLKVLIFFSKTRKSYYFKGQYYMVYFLSLQSIYGMGLKK